MTLARLERNNEDSLSGSVIFKVENLAIDLVKVPPFLEPHQLYLNAVSDFAVIAEGTLIYSEQLFPVVEYAIESQRWRRKRFLRRDFVFTSMEAQEPLLWIRRSGKGWIIGSDASSERSGLIQSENVEAALDCFYGELRIQVQARFGYDIATLFDWRAAHIGR